jgi:ATP-dependent DNA helicase RecG
VEFSFDGGFSVVFRKLSEISAESEAVEDSEITVRETVGKTVGKILEAIRDNPAITREELSQLTDLSIRGVEWNLARLKKEGKIKRIGPDKGGHWEIIDDSKNENIDEASDL